MKHNEETRQVDQEFQQWLFMESQLKKFIAKNLFATFSSEQYMWND